MHLYFFWFQELQLKPNHVPFKLVCYWEELLEKYTAAPEEHLERGYIIMNALAILLYKASFLIVTFVQLCLRFMLTLHACANYW